MVLNHFTCKQSAYAVTTPTFQTNRSGQSTSNLPTAYSISWKFGGYGISKKGNPTKLVPTKAMFKNQRKPLAPGDALSSCRNRAAAVLVQRRQVFLTLQEKYWIYLLATSHSNEPCQSLMDDTNNIMFEIHTSPTRSSFSFERLKHQPQPPIQNHWPIFLCRIMVVYIHFSTKNLQQMLNHHLQRGQLRLFVAIFDLPRIMSMQAHQSYQI